ncbi:MAG: hypothetical protein J6C41_07120 [Oscillospiraceae bacterium]|nr:hypothetical protein [Oscillospiraceae bacterium]
MKTQTLSKRDFPFAPYPNAATRRELMHKMVDHLLIIACSAGIASALMLLAVIA